MKKRIFSLILALALLCALLPQAALTASAETYSGSCGDNLTWSLDTTTRLLTITGSGEMADYTYLNRAPWYDYREAITAVSLPEGLTSIGYEAFYGCSALTSVTIPNSVTSIGNWAFCDCSALTDVTIPDSVTGIGSYAFSRCSALTSVTIGNGVTRIGFKAFSDCSILTSVTIPDSVTSIGSYAFSNCTALTSVTIGNSVTSIGSYAFFDCSALTGVTIPDSVTSIGNYAFYYCTALTSVTIPDSVTSIGYGAFDVTAYCNDSNNWDGQLLYIGSWLITAKNVIESADIKQGTIGIAVGTFYDRSALTSVTIPDGVTSIGEYAFSGCSALTGVTIPNSVTSIGDKAFGYYYDGNGYQKIDGFTISGYAGTAAQIYAEENTFTFVALGGFSDVAQSDYFFNPVMWATTHEPPITAGVAPGLFGPHNPCTREQIVTFLWAANGKPEPEGTGSGFSDVASNAWYYKPVMWAVENKVTSGFSDGSFGVGQPCTRAQAMTFLWAAKGKPAPSSMESTFSDVSSGDWFCKAILWAAENGITKGVGDGLFGVNNTCTRAQIITFLYKAYK